MGIRKIQFVEGEYYHIYNRGNSKQKIFLSNEDYDRFIKLLYISNSIKRINFRDEIILKNIDPFDFERGEQIVSIGAWVLMPNHFHLYLTIPKVPKGPAFGKDEKNNPISFFVKKLCTSYTMYFNKKYNRTGALFEGRFKSTYVNSDNQAKYLFSYIHLNPIKLIQKDWKEEGILNKQKALDFLQKYQYSSYLDFLEDDRIEKNILDKKFFSDYFLNKENFKKEIFEWLTFS